MMLLKCGVIRPSRAHQPTTIQPLSRFGENELHVHVFQTSSVIQLLLHNFLFDSLTARALRARIRMLTG